MFKFYILKCWENNKNKKFKYSTNTLPYCINDEKCLSFVALTLVDVVDKIHLKETSKRNFYRKKNKSPFILISILTDYKQENIENKNFQTYTKPILSSFVYKQMTPNGFFFGNIKNILSHGHVQ